MKHRSKLYSSPRLLLIPIILLWSITCFSQNELKAQAEYKLAENKIMSNKVSEAIAHLEEAEKLLGHWSVRISYLKITALDKLANSEKGDSGYPKKLMDEVSKYMSFASKNEGEIEPDNFAYVYGISQVWEKQRLKEEKRFAAREKQKMEEGKRLEREREKEQEKALARKAEQEIALGMTKKGISYLEGKDYLQAKIWLEKAAQQGDEEAHYWLGILYVEGKGVQKDSQVAYKHFQKVPGDLKKYPDLPYYRNLMVMENKEVFTYSDERDLVPGIIGAYQAGKQDAAAALGRFYLIGVDGKPDYPKSYEWYKKSGMDDNLIAAKIDLGDMGQDQKIEFLSSPLSSMLPSDQVANEINIIKNDLQKSVSKFRRKSVLNAGLTLVGIGCIYYGSELMKEGEAENDDTKDGIGAGLFAGGIGMTLPGALSFALMDRKNHRIEKEKLKKINAIPVLSVSPTAISYGASNNYGLILAVKF